MATKETDQIEPQATSDVSVRVSDQDLHDKTVRCIRCGFCLEACPTYRLTGRETESPRGRIYLVRSAIEGQLRWDENVQRHLDTCLGCRACEPACPSGVEYGSILEMARERLEKELIRGGAERFARGRLLRTLTDSRKIRRSVALSRLWPGRKMPGWISRLLSGARAEVETPVPETGGWPPADYPESARRVFFLEGCAMRALFSRTNAATVDLLRRHRCDVIAPPPSRLLRCAAYAQRERGERQRLGAQNNRRLFRGHTRNH
ncbi:MAG: 4Fe-4S dicluster domain-containing protein [Armatimonadetes bacterium]|nr:4Fe-4S dicluster domain-containing protein [Armatimonadota bacterium]